MDLNSQASRFCSSLLHGSLLFHLTSHRTLTDCGTLCFLSKQTQFGILFF